MQPDEHGKIFFFEVPLGGSRLTYYAGTINEFFGLRAERASGFSGGFVLMSELAPQNLTPVPPNWEQLGEAFRRSDPRVEALWLTYVHCAKKVPT